MLRTGHTKSKPTEKGMTLLEVTVAITILLIVVGFIIKSDAVAQRYAYKNQLRQQMIFYAAGLLEAQIKGSDTLSDPVAQVTPPFNRFKAEINTTGSVDGNPFLEKIEVKVYLENSPTDPEPVSLYTYRVKYNEEEQ